MSSQKRSQLPAVQLPPLSMVRMLWKRRRLVAGAWLVFSCAAAYVVYSLHDIYRAEAVVLVDSQKIPEKFIASTVQVSLQDSLNAISKQVLNVNRLRSIINDFHLYREDQRSKTVEEIVALLRKDLKVTVERDSSGNRSGVFRITYDGEDPKAVAGVVNRVTDLFIRENLSSREQRSESISDFMHGELEEAKKRLDEQEASQSEYKTKWAGELPEQQAALLGALQRLQTDLQGNQDAIVRAQQNKMMLENSLRFAEASLALMTRSYSQPALGDFGPIRQIGPGEQPRSEVLRAQLMELRLRYLDQHPEVRRLQAELSRVLVEEASRAAGRQNPSEERPSVGPPVSPQTLADLHRERERVASTQTQLELVKKEIESREVERRKILASIANYQKRVERLPIHEQQLSALGRDYEISKANYRSLLDKKIAASMASNMERSQQSEGFTVADPARVPEKPYRPRRPLYYGIGVAVGLMIGLALALALELKKNLFLGEWEVPPTVRVLGRISVMGPHAAASAGGVSARLALLILGGSVAGAMAAHFLGSSFHN